MWWQIVSVSAPTVAIFGGTWTWKTWTPTFGTTGQLLNGDYILEVYHYQTLPSQPDISTAYDSTAILTNMYCENFTVNCVIPPISPPITNSGELKRKNNYK